MKAVVITKFGKPESLRYIDVSKPVPDAGEALVKIRAASINAADIEWMKGKYFSRFFGSPKHRMLGSEMSGVVEAVGDNVELVKPGDAVLADLYTLGMGAFTEYVCVNEKDLTFKHDALTFEQASTVPEAGIGALQGLRPGDIKSGDQVLINGAGGGFGSYAVQIAKSMGAVVTGVDRADKCDFMRELGADFCVDYKKQDYTKMNRKYDFILDLNADKRLSSYKRALKENGEFIMAGGRFTLILRALISSVLSPAKNIGVMMWKPNDQEDIEEVIQMIAEGEITPAIDKVYKFSEAIEAIKFCWKANAKGKVVIAMGE